jgi:hypothetical protein
MTAVDVEQELIRLGFERGRGKFFDAFSYWTHPHDPSGTYYGVHDLSHDVAVKPPLSVGGVNDD